MFICISLSFAVYVRLTYYILSKNTMMLAWNRVQYPEHTSLHVISHGVTFRAIFLFGYPGTVSSLHISRRGHFTIGITPIWRQSTLLALIAGASHFELNSECTALFIVCELISCLWYIFPWKLLDISKLLIWGHFKMHDLNFNPPHLMYTALIIIVCIL